MDWEVALVSKAAQSGALDDLMSRGIEDHHFISEDARIVWRLMVEHATTYQQPPSFGTVRELAAQKAPDFRFDVCSDAADYIVDGFFKQAKRRLAIDVWRDLGKAIDNQDQVSTIEEQFLAAARELTLLVPSSRVSRFSDMSSRIERYHRRQFAGYEPGIPYGIGPIDAVTMGIQPYEFVVISGWTGTGKSTLMLYNTFMAYMAGKTPLIFSLEMESEALLRKYDALAVHFRTSALKALSLDGADIEAWERAAERASNAANDIMIIDDVGRCTPERVYAEMVKYKPDLVAIDYLTLMESSRKVDAHWQEVTYITKDLKQIARSMTIPILGVAQTNAADSNGRAGSNISYAKSIVRDADVLFELFCDDDMRAINKMELRAPKVRDGTPVTVPLSWQVDTMEFTPWSDTTHFLQNMTAA